MTFLEASLHRLVGRIVGMVTLLFVLMVCFWLVCLYRIESGAWPYGEKGESKGNVYHTDEKQTSTLKANELCPEDQWHLILRGCPSRTQKQTVATETRKAEMPPESSQHPALNWHRKATGNHRVCRHSTQQQCMICQPFQEGVNHRSDDDRVSRSRMRIVP